MTPKEKVTSTATLVVSRIVNEEDGYEYYNVTMTKLDGKAVHSDSFMAGIIESEYHISGYDALTELAKKWKRVGFYD